MSGIHFFGNAATTPGVMTAPATLRTDPNDVGDDTTGLTITFNAAAPAAQPAIQMVDKDGTTPVVEVLQAYVGVYNRKLGSAPGVFDSPACINGQLTPIPVELGSGARTYMGTGAPGTTFTGTGRVGDVFIRIDTPTTANQRYYVCTTAGTPGTWSGIA